MALNLSNSSNLEQLALKGLHFHISNSSHKLVSTYQIQGNETLHTPETQKTNRKKPVLAKEITNPWFDMSVTTSSQEIQLALFLPLWSLHTAILQLITSKPLIGRLHSAKMYFFLQQWTIMQRISCRQKWLSCMRKITLTAVSVK